MAEYTVRITNLEEIRRAFRKAPELMVKHLNTAIEGSVWQVERTVTLKGYSNEYYQNRTYSLTRNWVSMFQPGKGTLYNRMDYATYLHEGMGNIKRARPFLSDSLKEDGKQIEKNFENAVQKVLDEIGRNV